MLSLAINLHQLIQGYKLVYTVIISVVLGFTLYPSKYIYGFVKRRFVAMDDFFEAVKYRDFSRWFPEDRGPKDIRFLYKGFNEINRTIKEINSQNMRHNMFICRRF